MQAKPKLADALRLLPMVVAATALVGPTVSVSPETVASAESKPILRNIFLHLTE
jgi:hypothetical protein